MVTWNQGAVFKDLMGPSLYDDSKAGCRGDPKALNTSNPSGNRIWAENRSKTV